MEKRFLNIRELSEYIGFSIKTIYNWTSMKLIPFHKINGRVIRFDILEIDKLMESNKCLPTDKIENVFKTKR